MAHPVLICQQRQPHTPSRGHVPTASQQVRSQSARLAPQDGPKSNLGPPVRLQPLSLDYHGTTPSTVPTICRLVMECCTTKWQGSDRHRLQREGNKQSNTQPGCQARGSSCRLVTHQCIVSPDADMPESLAVVTGTVRARLHEAEMNTLPPSWPLLATTGVCVPSG